MSTSEPSYRATSARMRFVYSTAMMGIALLGLFWFAILLMMNWWLLALTEGVMAIASVLTWRLIRSGHISSALVFAQLTFYVIILIICLVYDIPNAAAPRVTHLFLLAVALLGYINYIRQPSRLQLAMIALAATSFVVFSCSPMVFVFADPLPDSIRVPGSWINTLMAAAIIGGSVYIMQSEASRNSGLARELQHAHNRGQLELYYQPQVDCSGQIIGAEALLRWKHAKRGYISPAEFIPAAEQSGMMGEIGGWVLEQACRTLADWQRHSETQHLRLAVNVSASQFLDEGFVQFVLDTTARHNIDRTRLKLELTESVLVDNIDLVVGKMTALHAAGIGTALDDFGTGYSSLSYLKRLPLEQLKIDRSFVQDVLENQRSAALARNVIQIGNDLGLTVLAEGVETQEQFDFLRKSGCTEFQGYLFGRPAPLVDLVRSLMPVSSAA